MTFPTPTTSDIRYAPHLQCRLDFFEAATTQAGGNAALVFIHGGGWNGNDRTLVQASGANGFALLDYVANSGLTTQTYNIFSIDFRQAAYTGVNKSSYPSFYPDGWEDVGSAIQFIKDNADTFNIDPQKVVLYGYSAGATMALWNGFKRSMPFSSSTPNLTPQRFGRASSSVPKVIVNALGPIDFRFDDALGVETWIYTIFGTTIGTVFGTNISDGGVEYGAVDNRIKAAASPLAHIERSPRVRTPVYSFYFPTTPTGKPYVNLHDSAQAAILHDALDVIGVDNDYELVASSVPNDYTPTPETSPSYALSARIMAFVESHL